MPEDRGQKAPDSKGPEAYLSAEERKALQRSLSFPEDLPPKFKSYLIDFIAVNLPQIPISQIVGISTLETRILGAISAQLNKTSASESTASTSYTNLTTVGPTLTVRDGIYAVFHGSSMQSHAVGFPARTAYMTMEINGSNQGDGEAATVSSDSMVTGFTINLETLTLATNTITAKYKVSGGDGATFASRFLFALRIGNAS